MDEKYFKVVLEVCAPDKDTIERMIDGMPNAEQIYESEIIDPDEPRLECRIRYEADWCGRGEHFIFENKWTNEDEWGFDTAFKLVDERLSYEALTKIRELMRMGIDFYFAKC